MSRYYLQSLHYLFTIQVPASEKYQGIFVAPASKGFEK
jgi:hypothetical protein